MLKSRMKTNSNFKRISHVYCPKYRIITGGSVIKDYKSVSQKSLLFSKKCCQMTAECCHMTTLRTTPQTLHATNGAFRTRTWIGHHYKSNRRSTHAGLNLHNQNGNAKGESAFSKAQEWRKMLTNTAKSWTNSITTTSGAMPWWKYQK